MTNPRYRKTGYVPTTHFIERLIERVPKFVMLHPELKGWAPYKGVSQFFSLVDALIAASEESRAHLNNTAYMQYLYEKYGFDIRTKFLHYKEHDFVMVCVQEPKQEVWKVVTVIAGDTRRVVKHKKFNHIPIREEKEVEAVLASALAHPSLSQRVTFAKAAEPVNVTVPTPGTEVLSAAAADTEDKFTFRVRIVGPRDEHGNQPMTKLKVPADELKLLQADLAYVIQYGGGVPVDTQGVDQVLDVTLNGLVYRVLYRASCKRVVRIRNITD